MTASDERAVAPYLLGFREFVAGRTTGADFEQWYLSTYKKDDTLWGRELFDVLDGVFADVDDYVDDDELRARAGGLDAAHLRQSVARALLRIEEPVPLAERH